VQSIVVSIRTTDYLAFVPKHGVVAYPFQVRRRRRYPA
jgi:hypothetical protein